MGCRTTVKKKILMKDILELVKALKDRKYKFTFDGEDLFEFPFGHLKLTMFIEHDDNQRPILIQYHIVIDDDDSYEDITVDEDTYDNYKDGEYHDLDIEMVIGTLDEFIELVRDKNKTILKIQKHIEEIEKIVLDDEGFEQVARSLIMSTSFM
jgi:hypothetical protein